MNNHKIFSAIVFFVVLSCMNGLQADSGKTLVLKKVNSTIFVDGVIDPIWAQADSVSDFVQFRPYHGKAPSRRTVAKMLSTDHALYCIIICEDERKNIQRNTGKLDDFGGDVVSLMIDTFGDDRTAYKFSVSASGVRSDCRLLDDARNRDYSWDGVWFSSAKIYDWGYVVEMEIPYRSIQYDKRLSEWGLDFDRWISTLSEDDYWCYYEENEGQRVSKFGRLIFKDFYPSVKGLNLEIYPVGISKLDYLGGSKYKNNGNAGIDILYNPSQQLTYQLTVNPDFAQIEADPYAFNISRYEYYFKERRPFFIEGNEVFMPSGRQQNSGFYKPLELFYSRRIGKKLPDGSEVPLIVGTKAFGRVNDWEYGGFLALTGEKNYQLYGENYTEERALFSSVRLKRQILGNSSIGLLYVGKMTHEEKTGVIDIDGAFRSSDWQLSYQLARSYKNSQGDFAASAGMIMLKEKWIMGFKSRYIGKNFDINEVGFVPWKGTAAATLFSGPRWYFEKGTIKQIMIYFGLGLDYERVDSYTDRGAAIGWNMQFRNNWGYEISFSTGKSKEMDTKFTSYSMNINSWFHTSPKWGAFFSTGISKSYNFARGYLANYGWLYSQVQWRALDVLAVGTSLNVFLEGNPHNQIEEITVNSRPFFSLTPVNDLNIRVYLDNVYMQSTDNVQQIIGGFLFSYNFRPKSWIYLAINEIRDRSYEYNEVGKRLPNRLHVTDRASVFKLKYLFYF